MRSRGTGSHSRRRSGRSETGPGAGCPTPTFPTTGVPDATFLPVLWRGDRLVTPEGIEVHGLTHGDPPAYSSTATAVFRPSAVAVYLQDVEGSPRNHFPVEVSASRSPSCSALIALALNPPGAAPPVSGQCPVFDSQQKISPARQTGIAKRTSIRCVPPR